MNNISKKNSDQKHHIIGIGASAGGLEALHEFFDYMPADTGNSFVVIQHLSPDHKSLLSELLAKHTLMRVYEAEDKCVLQPNCIYIIPSKKLLTIKDGKLILEEKLRDRLPNHAIDVFFESLAAYKKTEACAIILSGTGTDGSKGLEAIKREGGYVLVQDPLSAAFDGMPNSALATGLVDAVLPPELMPDEIVEYTKESLLAKSYRVSNKKDEAILKDILLTMDTLIGQDFSNYKRPTLFRRLVKRMASIGIHSLEEYRLYVNNNVEEIKALSREFLINVTRFFRDEAAFEVLRTQVIPDIFANKKAEDPIKIWSMACSTGEEAYSLAMLFQEYLVAHKLDVPVKIFATDVDAEALSVASKAVYPLAISNDVDAGLLQKYFIKDEHSYTVAPVIRKMVVFASHNILKDPPFSKLDLITCRNMLIYLDIILQGKILNKFYFALNVGSYLFLGPSENAGILAPAMEEISRKWKIFRCSTKSDVIDKENFLSPLENRVYKPVASQQPKKVLTNMGDIFRDTLTAEREIAGILVDRDFNVKQATGNFKAFLQFPEVHFNFNLLKLVPGDLSIALGVGLRKTVATNEKVVIRHLAVHDNKGKRFINLIVKPYLQNTAYLQPFLFIILEEHMTDSWTEKTVTDHTISSSERIEELEKELFHTRESLQAVIEELESTNEEMQSTNEEMISTNEELQSTNEELQSLNEELHTVSAEHQNKIKELLELNDDLDNYFKNSNIGQIFIDQNFIIRKFSPGISDVINIIGTDVSRSIADITTNIKDYDLLADLREVMQSGVMLEKEIVLNNGSIFLMRINAYVKRDESPQGAVINFIDVTESKKLSGIVEAVFNSTTNGISAMKAIREKGTNEIADFEYLTLNTSYEKMFGVKATKLPGKKWTETIKPLPDGWMQMAREVVEKNAVRKVESYLPHSKTWVDTTMVKLLDGIVVTHTDITEKKKSGEMLADSYEELKKTTRLLSDTNEQLEKSNMDLMQFASVASHDLKEPLRKIQAFGKLLEAKLEDKLNPVESGYLHKMLSASDRMQKLIEDVLKLSKLSNTHPMHSKVKLTPLIRNITDDLEIIIKEKNAVVRIGDLPEANAIPGQIHQVFQNLISNALKFNDKPVPEVIINSVPVTTELAKEFPYEKQKKYVLIQVKDNGIGFEPEYQESIFGLFQRLNGRLYEGTGIGLAIVKKIMENHGGFIKAASVVGEGTVFTLAFEAA